MLQKLINAGFFFSYWGFLILFLKVWDTLTTYKCVKTLEGHSGIVLALCTHEYVKPTIFHPLGIAKYALLLVLRFVSSVTGSHNKRSVL